MVLAALLLTNGLLGFSPTASIGAPRCAMRAGSSSSGGWRIVTPIAMAEPIIEGTPSDSDDDLDAMIRREVEAAFAGLEDSLAAEGEEGVALIQSQTKLIMDNVLQKFDQDQMQLSSALDEKVQALAAKKRVELMKKYDARLGEMQQAMVSDRENLRTEMAKLESLQTELKELQSGGGINRDKVVSGIALLVGLTGVGAALNEVLKFILGAGGDVGALGLNTLLGVAGIFYHLQRKG